MKQAWTIVVLLAVVVVAAIILVLRLQRTLDNASSSTRRATSAPSQVCQVDISVSTDAVEEAYKKGEAIYSQLEVARAAGERRRRELITAIALLEENGLSTEKGEDCVHIDLGFFMRNFSLRQMEDISIRDYAGEFIPYTLWLEEFPSAERKKKLERLGYKIQLDPISPQQLIAAAGKWRVPPEKQREAAEADKAQRRKQEQIREAQRQKDVRAKSLASCDTFEAQVRAGQSTLTSQEIQKFLGKCQDIRSGKLHDIWQKQ